MAISWTSFCSLYIILYIIYIYCRDEYSVGMIIVTMTAVMVGEMNLTDCW